MTSIRIHNEYGVTYIDIEGHAEYNPGNDIVCAAISTLSYMIINFFQRMYDNGELSDFSYTDEPGSIRIIVKRDNQYKIQFRSAMDMFTMGLEMIEEQFPDNLQIEDE